jgi:hypothetical protein
MQATALSKPERVKRTLSFLLETYSRAFPDGSADDSTDVFHEKFLLQLQVLRDQMPIICSTDPGICHFDDGSTKNMNQCDCMNAPGSVSWEPSNP